MSAEIPCASLNTPPEAPQFNGRRSKRGPERLRPAPGTAPEAGAGTSRLLKGRLELADLEDLRAAVGAGALDRRATVLHGHLLGISYLDLLAFLNAVAGWHLVSFQEPRGVRAASGKVFLASGMKTTVEDPPDA